MAERDDWTMGLLADQGAYRGDDYPNWPPSPSMPAPILPDAGGAQMGAIANTLPRLGSHLVDAFHRAFRAPAELRAENPYPPGSEEWQQIERWKADRAATFAGDWALNLLAPARLGGGLRGGVGIGGGKIVQPQPRMGDLADQSNYRPILPGDMRVSTRFPTAVNATEDPLRQHLSIGLPEMRSSPGYENNISLLSQYPGFAHLQAMGTDEAARAYIRQAAGNLDYLYRKSPQVMQERSPLWYEGAHEISDALARRWGVPRQSASGALASLSPQMDWFKNASLAERTGDILTSAASGRPMTSDMVSMAQSPKMVPLFSGERTGSSNRAMLERITGKRLDELTDPLDQSLWVRLYDEAHNPRAYRTITPEGNFGDFTPTPTGSKLADIGWGGLDAVQKAIRSLKSGGDMNIISPILGNEHKVRSFYNNIEVPHYPYFGDVTADTHQVAAAQLRPLSGSAPAVEHNLSGGAGGSGSRITGVQGTYGLTADATRRVAAEHGLLPRAAQSATWEPVRELFSPVFKRNPQSVENVDNIWRAYDRGDISIDQARNAIFTAAGGIGLPGWAKPGLGTVAPGAGSTYR